MPEVQSVPEAQSVRDLDQVLRGFLMVLPRLDPVIRAVTDNERLTMKLELTEPAVSAEIDLNTEPLSIRLDSPDLGTVGMMGQAAKFHELLLGRFSMGVAINHKLLVVRGPTARLMKVVPMFFVVPYIYPFYLQSIGRDDLLEAGALPLLHADRPVEGNMNKIISGIAYIAGYAIGLIKKKISPDLDVLAALESMGQGMKRAGK